MKCCICGKNIPMSVVKILATIKGNVAYITCEEHKGVVPDIGVVREFGNGILGSKDATLESPHVKEILNKDMDKVQQLFDHLKVVTYIEPFRHIEGPMVDRLQRSKHFGWYGVVASPGYDAFERHFKCSKEHVPYSDIQFRFIWKLFKLWVNQQNWRKDKKDW